MTGDYATALEYIDDAIGAWRATPSARARHELQLMARLFRDRSRGRPPLPLNQLRGRIKDALQGGNAAEQHVLPTTASPDAAVVEPRVAVLPVGAFEQHGPHPPLATDTLVAVAISNAIADVVPVRQLPPVTIGCSHEHATFPGTVSISANTLAAIVTDVAASLRGQGIEHLIVVNRHGGNYVLSNVVQQANAERPRSMALYPNRVDWDEARAAAGITTTAHEDVHAGELEASILLAAWPNYVRAGWQQPWPNDDHTAADRRHLLTTGMDSYSTTGVIGSPSLATEDKGRRALQNLGQNAVKVVEILTSGSPSQ